MAGAAATALGITPEGGRGVGPFERLSEFLARRQALLVLDNCEHVIAGAARLADHLLAGCPELQILATSRERLAVAGESLWPLQPLAIDAASELFAARAGAIASGFLADEQAMATINEICARLDGLPLAIELAAARMRALAPGDILARLTDQFRLLTGGSRTALPRHQTLRAVIDWSYDLLFDDERRVFERLSAFAGPCPLEAAEQVCAGSDITREDVADLLARLVDKSLITATQTSRSVRFGMLQALAEYGREHLAARGELAAVRARHTRWVTSLADVPDSEHGPAWFAAVREFPGDIRRAMASALAAGDADASLGIACGIGWSWASGGAIGSVEDCWRWLTASLALPQPDMARRVRALAIAEQLALAQGRDDALTGNALAQGAALRHLADLAVLRDRYDNAISALEQMLSILPMESHPAGITRMAQLGCLQAFQGRPGQSDRWHARAEAAAEDLRHLHLLVFAHNARGLTLRHRGRLGEAEQCHRHALELCRQRNVPEGVAMAHASLGYLAELRDDAEAAEQHHRASLRAAGEVADRQAQALALEGLAGAAALRGDAGAAGQLLGAASAFREGTVGTVMGQGTAMRETIIGRLLAAESDINRAVARHDDRQPRQIVRIRAQLADWQAAIGFAATLPEVDPARIAAWGFSVSGGHVLRVAARNPGLAAAIAQTPNADGIAAARNAARHQRPLAMLRLAGSGALDALGGLAGRRPRLVPLAGEPGTVAVVTTPDALDGDRALNPGGRYPDWVQAAAARSVLPLGFYRPGRDAARVRCPLLVVVCDQDQTALAGPGSAAARRAPRAELVRLAGSHYAPFLAGHEQAVEAELSFLRRHLVDDARADRAAAAASASAQGGRA